MFSKVETAFNLRVIRAKDFVAKIRLYRYKKTKFFVKFKNLQILINGIFA